MLSIPNTENMGKFTTLSKSQIKRTIFQYPQLPQEGCKAQALTMGTVNTYYRISCPDKKKYYLKIDEVGNLSRLKNEIRIFRFLENNKNSLSFDFPRLLRSRSGRFSVLQQKKHLLLFTEVAGKSILTGLKPSHLKLVGLKIAELHALNPSQKIKNHRFDLKGLEKTFSKIKSKLKKKHPELIPFIADQLEYLRRMAPKNTKPVLIHADLFPDNIHWIGNKLVGIIDFEAAGVGHPLFDVCVAFHALCHDGKNFDGKMIKSFIAGYETKKKMDKKSLLYFMQFTTLRFLITRLKDFDLPGLDPKMKDFRNYKDYLSRFEQIDDHFLTAVLS